MPSQSLVDDSNHIATVCGEGLNSLSFRVSDTFLDEDIAHLDVSGGSYPESDDSTYLILGNENPLRVGQMITVSLLEDAPSTFGGKTIDEMVFDEPPSTRKDFKLTAEMYNELRAQPKFRESCAILFESSLGMKFVGETAPGEYGFSFSVNWNSLHPEYAKVPLLSYSLDSLESHGPMNIHAEQRIYYGDSVRFELFAELGDTTVADADLNPPIALTTKGTL